MRKWTIGALLMAVLVAPVMSMCPNKCSGHGKCKLNDVCECMQNWIGGDCSGRLCPFTRAWQDTPESATDAHFYAECGNRGTCDREKGVCDCDIGFGGSGCRRMVCPDDCSGHGTCEFMEELAKDAFDKRIGGQHSIKYELWDQEKIMGCKCDPFYQGHNCAKRVCPKGDDPLTPKQSEMRQLVTIDTAAVEFFLTYYDPYGNAFTSAPVTSGTLDAAGATATCASIQVALRRLPNNALNNVVVTSLATAYPFIRKSPTSEEGTVQTQGTGNGAPLIICQVAFPSEPGTTGYQNLLECTSRPHSTIGMQPNSVGSATAICAVYEEHPTATAAGATTLPLSELRECSGRGVCDSTTGFCRCYAGHMGAACQKQEALV